MSSLRLGFVAHGVVILDDFALRVIPSIKDGVASWTEVLVIDIEAGINDSDNLILACDTASPQWSLPLGPRLRDPLRLKVVGLSRAFSLD
eukprot:CAMPEP_0203670046 /NCGR_PEP_ID=MMETSP0090-20130426/6247_1 /ASSEMBLY_ACC=CAM_ASM_001088 /TAXON_ID=426623 /ORGANISM="Chaetoceros affinis, Strain CCMP159" /LENGTH=89 /DNA_ID=CAMNT_0050534831 /DNA_START=276 /DNA_END=545 /DNA_ORIENTATION=-